MSEVRALLLTDVVDSTRLSTTLGDAAMGDLWAAHDRVARDLLAARGGREIDKTDGMLLLFGTAADALAYAADYHRALKALPVPLLARAGLHVGPVILRENSAADVARGAKPLEVDGLAKPTTARVMALARGGQTLLTADATRTLAATAPHLHSHGHWVLKGVAEPVELFEAGDAETGFEPPSDGDKGFRVVRVDDRWLPVGKVPNNLPRPLTSFIGRHKELGELRQALGATRLLTLTGSGGCGKTRLALQVAREETPAFPDGVWLVELAALSDPLLVPQTLAKTLGVKEEPGSSLAHTIAAHLDAKHALLVLDNAEHLLVACAELAQAVLQRCPHVTVLVTSREGLGMAGELTYRVPSLSLPDPKHDLTPQGLLPYEAVRLFVERSRLHAPQFALTQQNAAAVASVCYRLDGIPLAIELASARLRSLTVEDLNARLDQRFRILTGGSRTALPRQQTLRALIDWSHDLLSANEQALLRRLSVFAGGWTLAAAEQVCAGEGVAADVVLDLLSALVDKSLASADARDAAVRYRLLETVRQYARDRLLEAGEGELWRDRHLAAFGALVKEAEPHLRGTDQQLWMDRLETEHDNLRAALTWSCADGGDVTAGMALADSLFQFWYVRGYVAEAHAWYTGLLAMEAEVPQALRTDVLSDAGVMAWQKGDYAAARRCHETALETLRPLGDRASIASSLINLGIMDFEQGDYEAARGRFEEALEIRRELGNPKAVAAALHNVAAVAEAVGDHDRAWQLFDETVQIYRGVGDPWGTAHSISNLATIAAHRADHRAAHALGLESLSIRRPLGDRLGIAESLEGLARDLGALGSPARAAQAWGAAERLRGETGVSMSPTARAEHDRQVAAARAAIDAAAFDEAWQRGRAASLEEAIADALRPWTP
jgi:non-specific serine/threonine protein kinase